jgi:maleate isomerase
MTSEGQAVSAAQKGIVELEGTTHDSQRYVNAMGPRGVIGIMTPGPNVNVENEMMNMRPEGVINAVDRYYVPNQKIAANADWETIMRHVTANLDDSVRRLKEVLIDHLILGMSSQSYMGGERGSFALLEHLEKLSGVAVTMGAQSAEQAFKLCGAADTVLSGHRTQRGELLYFPRLRGGPRRRIEMQEHHPRRVAEI